MGSLVFIVEHIEFLEKDSLVVLTLLLWFAGVIYPLIFGFQSLSHIITVLLILSAAITVTKILTATTKILKREVA